MKNKLFFILMTLCLFVFADVGNSYADDDYAIPAGSSEFSIAFQSQGISGNGWSTNATTLMAEYGYYLSKKLEVGGIIITSSSGSSSTTQVDPMAKLHFIHMVENPKYVPYAGATLILASGIGSGSGSTIGLEFQGGLDAFISPKAAVSPEVALGILNAPGGSVTSIGMRVLMKIFF